MLSASCARFTQLLSSAQNLSLVSLQQALSTSASVQFRGRQRGGNFQSPPVNRHWLAEKDAEHFEALEDFINQDGSQVRGSELQKKTEALLRSQMKQQQRRVKQKVMERKFFKQPQEVNLLTWSAKQQIRYLHQEFPGEWTPQQLAASFPVSLDGVQRVLQSGYTPRSEQEIVRHDRRVMEHWHQLRESLAQIQGGGDFLPDGQAHISGQFQHLIDAGKLPLMINAGGSSQLPSPQGPDSPGQEKIGLFESIVSATPMVKAREEQVQIKRIEEKSGKEVKLLREIADFPTDHQRKMSPSYSDQSKNKR